MKLKKILALVTAALMLLSVVSCSKMTADEIIERMSALYDEENAIFADHSDQWDIVFNSIDKDAAMNNTDDYVTFIKKNIDACADLLSDDDRAILEKDVERIAEIEDELVELNKKLEPMLVDDNAYNGPTDTVFPSFVGKDFDGNDVDSSIFANNAVTVINFWFNGCKPCVDELGDLSVLNDSLKERGGELIGINVEAFDGNEKIIEEAKTLLAAKDATYRNVYFDSDSEAGQYAAEITSFPTTIFVDRLGNIIGIPMVGNINSEYQMQEVNARIDEIIEADASIIIPDAVG